MKKVTNKPNRQSLLRYDVKAIEDKWRKKWQESGIYEPDIANARKPFYNLMMFPYPSAEGLHVGNMYAFTGSDIFGRFKRMQGYDVFEPIGLDAFGIHSENYALKTNTHPFDLSKRTEENFYRQLHAIGNGFAWSHKIETNKKEYYRWTQWLFLQLYHKGLVEKKEAPVNWCPSCLTVLSDEQVISGKCERCSTEVVIKQLSQWFFKITAYADRLLQNLDWIDWDESVKTMQTNWIGKKAGAEISFIIKSNQKGDLSIKIFTTRPDTIYGVTALVLSPEHALIEQIVSPDNLRTINKYREHLKTSNGTKNDDFDIVKTGVKTDALARHPITGEELPIWVSDYVIGSYGTGAIMLVPGHDQRDYLFAKKFTIIIKTVIKALNDKTSENRDRGVKNSAAAEPDLYEGYGVLIDSGEYSGLSSEKASEKIVSDLSARSLGTQTTTYHIRDWLISRQRYWGPPIPIVYCTDCGAVPVKESDLPVELPYIENFRPTGTGKSPLAQEPGFYQTTCPACGKQATRETDVSDTFLDSSWYFLRYPSTDLHTAPFDKTTSQKWLPVDRYIGGKEHTVLHLLYSRFITMVLYDLGYIDFEEPFKVFRAHGLLIKDGAKISKSRGNVINPDQYIEMYGSDTLRTYLMFLGPFSEGGDFRYTGINGTLRFLNKMHRIITEKPTDDLHQSDLVGFSKTVKKVTEDIENLRYNTAIAAVMEYANILDSAEGVSQKTKETLVKLMAPFAPFLAEELWSKLGHQTSVHTSEWPDYDPAQLVGAEIAIVVQINGKTRGRVTVPTGITEPELASIISRDQKLQTYLTAKPIKKSIYIPGRLINLVV